MHKIDSVMNRSILRKIIKTPFLLVNLLTARFSNPKRMAVKHGIELYGGSAWWLLPDDMVNYLIEISEDDAARLRFKPAEIVAAPEEVYFQTVLMNSSFGTRIKTNPKDMIEQACKTYAIFNPVGMQFTGHPYVFTIADTEELNLISTDHFFARKFDEGIDSDVLDWLDSKLGR